ncbi:YpmA family protein [Bacillaceae bacterium IKA-2]|nr:YpmA family protein [Bacillaceae bacterium IKA-2]
MVNKSNIEVISTVTVEKSPDLYKIVDACNKTLKDRDLMFGLALDEENQTKMVFTIYRT